MQAVRPDAIVFTENENQKMIAQMVRDFGAREIKPKMMEWDESQEFPVDLFHKMGRENYIKLPKAGTNPRGAEITKEALTNLVADKQCQRIIMEWQKTKIDFNPYKKWVDFWKED